MKIMGIDYGDIRVGIALSDILGITANGLETIKTSGNLTKLLDRLERIVSEQNVKTIVVGYPKNMNGTTGFRAEKTDQFINLLQEKVPNIFIVKWDERLTTVAANRVMHEVGIKKTKKKSVVDQIAAVLILQGYLDSKG